MIVTIAVLANDGFYKNHLAFSACFMGAMLFIAIFRISHHYLFDKIKKIPPKTHNYILFTSILATSLIRGIGFAYFMIQPEALSAKRILTILRPSTTLTVILPVTRIGKKPRK